MKKIIIAFIFISVAFSCKHVVEQKVSMQEDALPYYTTAAFAPQWIRQGSAELDTIHSIPSFSFTDQSGNIVTQETVRNKIYVADFFFTSCPGICPRLTKNLKLVQDAFINDSQVVLLSHSVTPEKDNAATLKRYAVNYGVTDSKWHLLTGNRDSIYAIARKSYFADEDLGEKRGTNDFLHTENMLLLDKKRRIRGIYKGTSPLEMQNIITDIKILEKEKDN